MVKIDHELLSCYPEIYFTQFKVILSTPRLPLKANKLNLEKMTTSVLKAIAKGILLGAALFFIPHFILGFLIVFGIMRLFMGKRRGGCHNGRSRFDFMDRIRQMSDEEYEQFKTQKHCHC